MISGFGNPLLDTIVFIKDTTLLQKYGLEKDGQKEVSSEIMQQLTEDVKKMEKTTLPGGCAQNSLRVFQWLTEKEHDALIFGAVGKDVEAKKLKELVKEEGVIPRYVEKNDAPTGRTISLVYGTHRSLVAHIGAAEKINIQELVDHTDVRSAIYNSYLVYIEGFFLTNRFELAKYILNCCNILKLMVAFNISGEYVCDLVPEALIYFAENSDIIFGNKKEFEALRKIMKLKDIKELVTKLLKGGSTFKIGKENGNVMVITDGENPGECYYGENEYFQFTAMHLEAELFKDSTGAGDAFVGGFLAGLAKKKSLDWCATIGCYAANEIIRQVGCALPKRGPAFLFDGQCNPLMEDL